MKDVLDQYETVARISQAQTRFQQGVTEFYRARTDTKMTIAAERLAVIAAITLPITSLSSVIGMNVIVNDSTRWIHVISSPAHTGTRRRVATDQNPAGSSSGCFEVHTAGGAASNTSEPEA